MTGARQRQGDTSSLDWAPRSAPRALSPGTLVAGRYEIVHLLGRGGMGIVYKAHDLLLAETVAVKTLRVRTVSAEIVARLREETRLARQVSHHNVCRVHEYGEDDDLRFISMAFIDGTDLKRLLQERGPLPWAEAYDTALAVAAGLQAVHDAGIVHRDLKTSNIMRDRNRVVRLMDFGLAKDAAARSGDLIVGTPDYMSPEQAAAGRLDSRSDLYGLGIVLYELFTARRPFRAQTPMAVIQQHIHAPFRLDQAEAARLPPALKPVLVRALAKIPADRFASACEMADAIRAARSAPGRSGRPHRSIARDQTPSSLPSDPQRKEGRNDAET